MIYIDVECISKEIAMKIAKWGNSLAIRLPAELVEKLGVKEGDEIDATPGVSRDAVTLKRKKSKEELWEAVRRIRQTNPIPAGSKFTRADAYEDDEY
jgi:antitoxin MazE